MRTTTATCLLLALFTTCPPPAHGQRQADDKIPVFEPVPVKKIADLKFKRDSFTFARVRYSGRRPGPGGWATDYPDADLNFTARFHKVTGLQCDPQGKVTKLTDLELMKYPIIYLSEAGGLLLTDDEVGVLRRYLTLGGFLMADDFWGEAEWESFLAQIKRVFPEQDPVELPIDHPIFHCFYDIKAKPQVPNIVIGTRSRFDGVTWEREDGREPHYRGVFDAKGRLMAIFCHNTDLGDGWEREGENLYYYREFSLKKAYPMGINIVVYALTQ